jgi:hypothetical protein
VRDETDDRLPRERGRAAERLRRGHHRSPTPPPSSRRPGLNASRGSSSPAGFSTWS